MLPLYIISKYNVRSSCGMLFQWLNVSVRLCSSSDSSDSDSDNEKVKQRKLFAKSTKITTPDNGTNLEGFLSNMMKKNTTTGTPDTEKIDLTAFVDKMLKAKKLEKNIDVALKPKKSMPKKVETLSYEKQLVSAAENVADKLGGDKTKTTMDLLQKVLHYRVDVKKKDKLTENIDQYKAKSWEKDKQMETSTDSTKSDKNFIKEKDIGLEQFIKYRQSENEKQESSTNEKYLQKISVVQTLLEDYKKQVKNKSISQQLLQNTETQQSKMDLMKKPHHKKEFNLWDGVHSQIFENMGDLSPDTPELKTWAELEQKELKALTTYSPTNIFQEMILWTEQGKLWKFPIDNEQGMEEEHNIHFSEHVFTERYLKGWCPTSGPIRHFMELVCVGLSKNPYMTVEEKINHIMWYRDYFKSKEELLQELGAIKEPFSDTARQITK